MITLDHLLTDEGIFLALQSALNASKVGRLKGRLSPLPLDNSPLYFVGRNDYDTRKNNGLKTVCKTQNMECRDLERSNVEFSNME